MRKQVVEPTPFARRHTHSSGLLPLPFRLVARFSTARPPISTFCRRSLACQAPAHGARVAACFGLKELQTTVSRFFFLIIDFQRICIPSNQAFMTTLTSIHLLLPLALVYLGRTCLQQQTSKSRKSGSRSREV
jgi:hypothetical protein